VDDLFLMSEHGRFPVSEPMRRKYGLHKGMQSPFSGFVIADRDGDSTADLRVRKPREEFIENNQLYSTAEMIDISLGVDSYAQNDEFEAAQEI